MLDPMTGEVSGVRFDMTASVAERELGFIELPKAVYERYLTGFGLCRALRVSGVDRAVGAVSMMHRLVADRGRKDRSAHAEGLPGLARRISRRGVGARRAH